MQRNNSVDSVERNVDIRDIIGKSNFRRHWLRDDINNSQESLAQHATPKRGMRRHKRNSHSIAHRTKLLEVGDSMTVSGLRNYAKSPRVHVPDWNYPPPPGKR